MSPVRVADSLLSTIDAEYAIIRLMHATENFRQGGFAGAVVTNASQNLSLEDINIHALQSTDVSKALRESTSLEKCGYRCRCCHSTTCAADSTPGLWSSRSDRGH